MEPKRNEGMCERTQGRLEKEAGFRCNESSQYCSYFDSSTTRRTFLASLLAALASACAGPTLSGSAKREQELFDEAANLSQRVTVDLIALRAR